MNNVIPLFGRKYMFPQKKGLSSMGVETSQPQFC